jgi:hypothetical protein
MADAAIHAEANAQLPTPNVQWPMPNADPARQVPAYGYQPAADTAATTGAKLPPVVRRDLGSAPRPIRLRLLRRDTQGHGY